jgi:hypothetical protein
MIAISEARENLGSRPCWRCDCLEMIAILFCLVKLEPVEGLKLELKLFTEKLSSFSCRISTPSVISDRS